MASPYSIYRWSWGDQRALDGNLDLLLGKLFQIHTLIGLGQFQGVNNIPSVDVPAGIEDPQQVIKNRSQALSTWGRSCP